MEMNRQTLKLIFDFVSQFPHYTCRAPMQICHCWWFYPSVTPTSKVGLYSPMQKASAVAEYSMPGFAGCHFECIELAVFHYLAVMAKIPKQVFLEAGCDL